MRKQNVAQRYGGIGWNTHIERDTMRKMTPPHHRIRDIAARIRRLQTVLKQFDEGRRRLEQLHSSSEGVIRVQIEQVLALNREAIQARRRDLEALESERTQLESEFSTGISERE